MKIFPTLSQCPLCLERNSFSVCGNTEAVVNGTTQPLQGFYLSFKVLPSSHPSLWYTGPEHRTWCLTKACCKTINLWYLTSLGNVCDGLPATSGASVWLFVTGHRAGVTLSDCTQLAASCHPFAACRMPTWHLEVEKALATSVLRCCLFALSSL